MKYLYCLGCNNKVMESIRICPKCGSKDFLENTVSQVTPISPAVEINTSSSAPVSSSGNKLGNLGAGLFGIIFFIGLIIYGIAYLRAGYQGIELYWGQWWASGFIVLAILFRFTIPITVGAFFCATEIWGWNWFGAGFFAAPGLIFILPSVVASAISLIKK